MSEETTVATGLQVSRKEFVKLCQKLKHHAVDIDWPNARLLKKAEKFPGLYGDTIPDGLTENEGSLLKEIIEALNAKVDLAFDEAKKGAKKEAGTGEKKTKKKTEPKGEKKVSALDAAATVLAKTKKAMSCPELIEKMGELGLWTSPGGLTPAATLSAAIGSEIRKKGTDSRFEKESAGKFILAAKK